MSLEQPIPKVVVKTQPELVLILGGWSLGNSLSTSLPLIGQLWGDCWQLAMDIPDGTLRNPDSHKTSWLQTLDLGAWLK
jgi:hypothetical protein